MSHLTPATGHIDGQPQSAPKPHGLLHPIAGLIALLTIAVFWTSTVVSELFGSEAAVIAVKTAIPWGFLVLIPALATAGASGLIRSGGRRAGLVGIKLKRMPIIAANGILVLIPCALFLAARARAGDIDATFYVVQILELLAGAANITLLSLQMRDGLRMTRARRAFRQGRPTSPLATRRAGP